MEMVLAWRTFLTRTEYCEQISNRILWFLRTLLEEAEVDFEEGTVAWHGRLIRARPYPISVSVEGERRLVQTAAGRRAAEQLLQDFTNVCEACEKRERPHLTEKV